MMKSVTACSLFLPFWNLISCFPVNLKFAIPYFFPLWKGISQYRTFYHSEIRVTRFYHSESHICSTILPFWKPWFLSVLLFTNPSIPLCYHFEIRHSLIFNHADIQKATMLWSCDKRGIWSDTSELTSVAKMRACLFKACLDLACQQADLSKVTVQHQVWFFSHSNGQIQHQDKPF